MQWIQTTITNSSADQPAKGDSQVPVPPRRGATGGAARPMAGLTRERILTAALEIVDADGVDALSMRRLGRALSREAMTLYHYAPAKAALLDGITELLFTQLTVDPGAADWESELHRVAGAFRAIALRHPNVAALLVTRPLATPLGLRPTGVLRPVEDLLTLLVRAGFAGADAVNAYRLFFSFLNGHILDEMQKLVDDPDETDDLLRLGLHRLPPQQFPQLRALAPAFTAYDGQSQLDTGINLLLTGLRARLG